MDLGFLTVPLTAAALAFGFAVITDTQTVHIEKIAVPGSVSGPSGYTSGVIIAHLADEMRAIDEEAHTGAHARTIELQGEKTWLMVLADYLKVTPLIRVAQESAGLIPFSFNGEIVIQGDNKLEFVLRGFDDNAKPEYIVTYGSADHLSDLIKETAYEAVRVVDPYILAAYQFKRDYRTRDFTRTLEVIRRELTNTDTRNYKWMYNLWGMVLYQQGDRAGAIGKFREALAVDPKFGSPLLNWGVVLARQGHNDQAIEKFRQVVTNRNDASPTTKAAALSEWGFSLALLGRNDQAFAKFHEATATDPNFADVYSSWAEVLSAMGKSDEAAKMTAISLKMAPTEAVYTENLIGSVQDLPASASIVN